MPTIPSIRTSVENKNVLVLDEHAKTGTFIRDARGRLITYTGGFSVVFPYETTGGEKWAFRCWHSDVANSKKRYQTIAEAVKNANLDFLCEFQYIDEGVNVEGNIYPTTRMRWIDGVTIKDYICQNKDSKDALMSLAEKFLQMTQALHAQSLAHGDLQHGNILVDKNHQLYLVDYDSFYCPKLKCEPDTVTGLPDYQHPSRIRNKAISEKLDYFSELIIYLSILAIAENPLLVEKYKVKDADRLLFAKQDFVDIKKSAVYNDIALLGENFHNLLGVLEKYLECTDIDELWPFDTYILERRIEFISSITKIKPNTKAELKWNVPFDADIKLKNNINDVVIKCNNKGRCSVRLIESAMYYLLVKDNIGHEIVKTVLINVYDECSIDFKTDKYYIYPTIPVTLSWNVRNAKNVWLNGDVVEHVGSKIVEPTKAELYMLSAEDEFGKKEKHIEIGMLPVPQVKSLFVPVPDIVSNMSISIRQPKYIVDAKMPIIDIGWIKTEVPKVPSLTDLKLQVELSPPLPKFSFIESTKTFFRNLAEFNYKKSITRVKKLLTEKLS